MSRETSQATDSVEQAEVDLDAAFSGTRDVTPRHEIDEKKLASYLASVLPGFSGPLVVREFKGGQSNPEAKPTPEHQQS